MSDSVSPIGIYGHYVDGFLLHGACRVGVHANYSVSVPRFGIVAATLTSILACSRLLPASLTAQRKVLCCERALSNLARLVP